MQKLFLLTFTLITPLSAFSNDHAKVTDLSWLTGRWDGQMGSKVREENWSLPQAGTIASLVRQTDPDGMDTLELVYIEEAEETLILYIQQWDAGFESRTPTAQKMTMNEITENSVTFKAVGEGGLAQLRYSRPSIDAFQIDVVTAGGQEFTIKLSPQTRYIASGKPSTPRSSLL